MNKIKILIADDDPDVINDIIIDLLPCMDNSLLPAQRIKIISDEKEGQFCVKKFNLAVEAEKAIEGGFIPDIALIDVNFSAYEAKANKTIAESITGIYGKSALAKKNTAKYDQQIKAFRDKELTRYRGIDTILFLKNKYPACIVAGYTHFGSETDIFNKLKTANLKLSHEFNKANIEDTVYELHKGELKEKGKTQPYIVSHFFKDVLTYLASKYYINLESGSKKTITSLVNGKASNKNDSEKTLLDIPVTTKDKKDFILKHLLLCNAATITNNKKEPVVFSGVKELFKSLVESDMKVNVNGKPELKGDWALDHMQEAFSDFTDDHKPEHSVVIKEAKKLTHHFFDYLCLDEVDVSHQYSENFRCDSFINQKLTNQNFFRKYKNNITLRIALSAICEINNNKHVKYTDKDFRDKIINMFIIFIDNNPMNDQSFKKKLDDTELYKPFFGKLGLSKKKNEQRIQTDKLSGLEQQILPEVIESATTHIQHLSTMENVK